MTDLHTLIRDLKLADPNDQELFHSLVQRTIQLLSLTDADIARQFDMSRPSVTRWRNGSTAPHPALRRHVYAFFLRRARKALSQRVVA